MKEKLSCLVCHGDAQCRCFEGHENATSFANPDMSKASYTTHDAEEYRMQLRDQFAMAALTGMLARGDDVTCLSRRILSEKISSMAYLLADEMLEARNK